MKLDQLAQVSVAQTLCRKFSATSILSHLAPGALASRGVLAAIVFAFASNGVIAQVATATQTAAAPNPQFIGETFSSDVCFDNTGASTGFQPVYLVRVPANITIANASYLGSPVTPELIGTGAGSAVDPITGATITLAAGERLYILRYPLGSVTPTQPAQCLSIGYAIPLTATVGSLQNIAVTPIFSYGADALDNPATDPPIVGTPVNVPVTPSVIRVTKNFITPEDETATGPDWPRTFELVADVANGAAVTGFNLSDTLPSSIQYVSHTVTNGTCSTTATPATTAPGGTLTVSCGTVTGTASATDVRVLVTYFVPKCETGTNTALGTCTGTTVLAPTGAASIETNTTTANASYAGSPITATATDTFTAESQTVRKGVQITTDTGPSGPSPDDILTYTITGEISDYFQFQNFSLADTVGDGQTFVPGSLTLSYQNNTAAGAAQTSATAPLTAANFTVSPKTAAGTTPIAIRLSDEMTTRLSDGVLRGRDTFGATLGAQGTTYTITYRTQIDRNYAGVIPPGSTSALSAGDTITNAVSSTGTVVGNGATVTDTSATSLPIVGGSLAKQLAFVNGAAPGSYVRPGDLITYRLRYTLPTGTYEDLKIKDFLPLPVLTVPAALTQIADGCTAAPANNQWCLTNATNIPSVSPNCRTPVAVIADAAGNSITWDFPKCEPTPVPTAPLVVELMFTTTVGSQPFGDGLNLTNLSEATINNSSAVSTASTSIVQIKLAEPELNLNKTIVASSNSTSTCPATTPAQTIGVASCSNSDGGDTITYRLRVENTGHFPAYDLRLTDDVGAGAYSSGCTISNVTNGAGTAVAFTGALTTASPLSITGNPAIPNNGDEVLDPAEVLWVTYTCTIPAGQNPRAGNAITNTARIVNYSNGIGGANFATNTSVPGPNAATAEVGLKGVQSISKVTQSTNLGDTTNNPINVGEQIDFCIAVSLAEGNYQNFSLTDSTTGIASTVALPLLSSCTTAASTTPATTCNAMANNTCIVGSNVSVAGTTVTVGSTAATTPGWIIVRSPLVAFSTSNIDGVDVTNTASVSATNIANQTASTAFTVDNPNPAITKAMSTPPFDAGNTVTVTLNWSNADANNPQYRCVITDDLAAMTPAVPFDLATIQAVSTPANYTFSSSAAGLVTYTYTADTPCNSGTATFTAQLLGTVPSNTTFTNTAQLAINSLPASHPNAAAGQTTTASGTATLATNPPLTPTKTLVSTSLADTSGANLVIGERAVFDLTFTFPEGVTRAVTLSDVLAASGLTQYRCVTASQAANGAFCGATLTRSGANISSVSNPQSINSAVAGAPVALIASTVTEAVASNTVSLALGDVSVAATGTANSVATYVLRLELQSQNVASNQDGVAVNDVPQLSFTSGAGVATNLIGNTLTLTTREPQVAIQKDVTPTAVQGGDIVTYSIVVGNTGNAPIYDTVVCDALPTQLTAFGVPSFAVTTAIGTAAAASTTFTVAAAQCGGTGSGLRGVIDMLDPGEVVTITMTAQVVPGTAFGSVVTNVTSANGSSLPSGLSGDGAGTTGAGSTNERTGTQSDSNFTANDSATFTSRAATIGKTVVNPKSSYAVGEIVRYRLQVGLPTGTTTNLRIEDSLPAGLRYASNVAYTFPATVTVNPNPPTVTTAGAAPQVTWTFASIAASAPSDIFVQFDAVVENVLTNQTGTLLTNDARIVFDNPAGGTFTAAAPNPPAIQVGEPNLTVLKSITTSTTNIEAGAIVGYSTTISNAATANTTPAYRTAIADTLPALMTNPGAFVVTITGTGPAACPSGACLSGTSTPVSAANVTTTASGWTVNAAANGVDLYPGVSVKFEHTAQVSATAPVGSVIGGNFVGAAYASLPTASADERNGTTTGSDDDNNALLNNYNESATTAGFTLQSIVNIVKSLLSPSDGNVTIGQLVTYRLRIDLSQGTTQNVNVTDVLPPDLSYVSHATTWGSGCTAGANPVRGGAGQTVTLAYGDVVCPADADLNNDFFIADIVAKVNNVVVNQAGRTLTNGGSTGSDNAASTNVFVTTGAANTRVDADADGTLPGLQGVTVTIVEPTLTIAKGVNTAVQSLGDEVVYTLTIAHAPGCTVAAYDVRVVDTLPADLVFVSSVPSATTSSPLSWSIPSLACGATQDILVRARVNPAASTPQTVTNTAAVAWGGIPGATGAATDGRTGSDGVGGLNDYVSSTSVPLAIADRRVLDATKTVAIVLASDTTDVGVLNAGEQIEYTIIIKNFDPALITTGTVFTDAIPASTTFVPGSITSADFSGAAYGTPSFSGGVVTVQIGNMAPVSSTDPSREVTIKFRVSVNAGTPAGTLIRNQGSVDSNQTAPEPTDVNADDSNGDQPTDIFVGGPPPTSQPLYSTKSVTRVIDADSSTSNTVGDTMEYTLTVVNNAATPLSNVVLTDVWPAGLGYVTGSANPSTQVTVAPATRGVTWTIGALAPAQTVTATFRVTVDALSAVTPSGVYVNQGSVTGQTSSGLGVSTLTDGNGIAGDGNQPTTFTAGATGSTGAPAIDLQKRVLVLIDANGNGQVNPGDTLQYSITLVNTGTANANNVQVVDNPVPSQVSVVPSSVATSIGTVTTATTTAIGVNVGSVAPNQTVTITFSATVNAATAGQTAVNQAVANGSNFTPVLSDDNGDGSDGRNPNQTPIYDPATVGAGFPTVVKSLVQTSESVSSGNDVLIGEVLTYSLSVTVPRGTTGNLSLIDTLPVGQRFIDGSATIASTFNTALNSSINPAAINATSSETVLPLSSANTVLTSTVNGNQVITVPLGNVINSDSESPVVPERYTLVYRVVVENIASNIAGVTLTNSGTVGFNNALNQLVTLAPSTISTTIVEPKIGIVKESDIGTLLTSGGGIVRFTFNVTNPSTVGNVATGYNVVVRDILPAPFVSYTVVSATAVGGVTGVSNVGSGSTVAYTADVFPPNGSLTLVIDAVAAGPIASGSTVTNTATASWTSLPGSNGTANATAGAPGSTTGERTGAGAGTPNTYIGTDSHVIRVGAPSLIKSIVDPRANYAVGEEVTFRLLASYPTVTLSGNQIVDTLPAGLEFVPGSLTVVKQPNLSTDPATIAVAAGAGNTVSFNLGIVDNPDPAVRTVDLTYRARVRNIVENQNGIDLTNSAVLSYLDPSTNTSTSAPPAAQTVRVGEPVIGLTKTVVAAINPIIAGSTIRYRVVMINSGSTPAFDQIVEDRLPSVLSAISNISITPTYGPSFANLGTSTVPVISGSQITSTGWVSSPFQLNPGDSVAIEFDAVVQNSVIPGQTFTNLASTTFSSLPGVVIAERNGTTPGSVQTDSNLNNYNATASTDLTAGTSIALSKAITSSSAASGVVNSYAVGEQINYRLRVSLAPGTYNAVTINDVLPTGLSYVSHSLTLGHGGITPANSAAISFTQAGQSLTFGMGTVVNPARNPVDSATDFFDVTVLARVDNVLSNQNAVTLTNAATLTHTPAGGAPTTGAQQAATARVVEPLLVQSKAAVPGSASLGDEVTFTIRIAHSGGSSSTAYNVLVKDVLPVNLSYVANSASLTPDAASAGQNLQWTLPALPIATGFFEISYRARVAVSAVIGQALTNQIAVTYQSTAATASVGAPNGPRDGSTGVAGINDYAGSASASVTPSDARTIRAPKTVVLLADSDNSGGLTPGDTLEYTIALTNMSSNAQTNVVFTDAVPLNTTYVAGSLSSTLGTVVDSAATLRVNIGTMPPAQVVTVTFRVTVNAGVVPTTVIRNQGSVDSDQIVPTPTDDPALTGGQDPTDIVVAGGSTVASPAVTATKSVALSDDSILATGTVNVGDTVTFTIDVRNSGNVALTNVVLTDAVPSGLTVLAVSSNATSAANAVTANLGSLAVGQSAAVTITARANVVGTLNNQGSVTSSEITTPVLTDGDPGTPGAQPTPVPVLAPNSQGTPALLVVKSVVVAPDNNLDGKLNPGETVRYTIVVRNLGMATAQNVVITDTLPAGLVLVSAVPSQGALVSGTSSSIVLNIGSIGPSASASITITANVPAATAIGTTFNNVASASTTGLSATLSNPASIVVEAPANLLPPVGVKVGNDVGPPVVEWRMVWTNSSNGVPLNVQITDPIGAAQTYRTGTLVCTPSGTTTVTACAFDAANNRIAVDARLGADLGKTTEASADNELVITFRVTVRDGVVDVRNTAGAHWDRNNSGSVNDDLLVGQSAVAVAASAQIIPREIPTLNQYGLFTLMLLVLLNVRRRIGVARR